MPVVQYDLSRHADALDGKPEDHFVDEHHHVYRVVNHATGNVVGVLRPDGTMVPYRAVPNPAAPPVTATMATESGPAASTSQASSK